MGGITGYVQTFLFDSLYVDFDRVEAGDIPNIPQDDPRWIGKLVVQSPSDRGFKNQSGNQYVGKESQIDHWPE